MGTRIGKAAEEDRRLAVGPVPVARLLAAAARPLMRRAGAAVSRLGLDWADIVGPALAAVTAPERLTAQGRDGAVLTIRAAGPVALELQHLAPQILERVNAHLGPGRVARLKVVRRPLAGLAEAQAPPPLAPPRPVDAAALARIDRAVGDLPEGPLRDSLARLGRAVAGA